MRSPAAAALVLFSLSSARAQTPEACVPDALAVSTRSSRYDAIILKAAERRRLNPRLVKAIIAAESQFAPGAVSPSGARGLMQLMPATAREMGASPLAMLEPRANVAAGTRYVARLFAARRRSGRDAPDWLVRRVVAAYHSGPAALDGSGWSPATRRYVLTVMNCYRSDVSVVRASRPAPSGPVELLARNERREP